MKKLTNTEYEIIKESLYLSQNVTDYPTDDEIDTIPSDPINGREFILNVTEKVASINGNTQKVKDYSTSKWSSNISPLTEAEQE